MEEHQSDDSVLVLSDELILDSEATGRHAVAREPDVLLLRTELPPERVIKKIDVGPRVSGLTRDQAQSGRDFHAEFNKPSQVEKPSRRQRKAVWQGGLPFKASATFRRRETQVATQPERQGTEPAELERILAEARAFAAEYGATRARTRMALYEALGRTYDFTIRADEQPAQFAQLIVNADLTAMDRATYSPIVKLVFGADYDKTRVAEFAAAIAYGRRRNLPTEGFTAFLNQVEGGLKAVVGLERLFRKGDSNPSATGNQTEVRPEIARKLREIRPTAWNDIPAQGDEFTLLVARRLPDGSIAMVGEVPRDIGLLERAARRLLADLDHTGQVQVNPTPYHPEEV